jgi:hypothetical protein
MLGLMFGVLNLPAEVILALHSGVGYNLAYLLGRVAQLVRAHGSHP